MYINVKMIFTDFCIFRLLLIRIHLKTKPAPVRKNLSVNIWIIDILIQITEGRAKRIFVLLCPLFIKLSTKR